MLILTGRPPRISLACSFNVEDPRCAMPLDDINPDSWRRLLAATSEYCAAAGVAARFDELAARLGAPGSLGGADRAVLAPSAATVPGGLQPGTSRGVVLVEAPPRRFQDGTYHHVEATAAAVSRLPQLLRRVNLATAAATQLSRRLSGRAQTVTDQLVTATQSASGTQLIADLAGHLAACQAGVLHLALHVVPTSSSSNSDSTSSSSRNSSGGPPAGSSLVAGWQTRTVAVLDPSPEAVHLAGQLHEASGVVDGQGCDPVECGGLPPDDARGGLAAALQGRTCADLPGGALLVVLSQQRVRTPTGVMATTWLFEITAPDAASLLTPEHLLTLAPALTRATLVSAAALPAFLVSGLLRSGARAVVCPSFTPGMPGSDGSTAASDDRLQAAPPEAIDAFFSAFYAALLARRSAVPCALQIAEEASPALAGLYAVHCL